MTESLLEGDEMWNHTHKVIKVIIETKEKSEELTDVSVDNYILLELPLITNFDIKESVILNNV